MSCSGDCACELWPWFYSPNWQWFGERIDFFVNCIDDDGCEKWEGAKIFQIPKFFLHFGLGKKFMSKSYFYRLKHMQMP